MELMEDQEVGHHFILELLDLELQDKVMQEHLPPEAEIEVAVEVVLVVPVANLTEKVQMEEQEFNHQLLELQNGMQEVVEPELTAHRVKLMEVHLEVVVQEVRVELHTEMEMMLLQTLEVVEVVEVVTHPLVVVMALMVSLSLIIMIQFPLD